MAGDSAEHWPVNGVSHFSVVASAPTGAAIPAEDEKPSWLLYVDGQALTRDCLTSWLSANLPEFKVLPISSAAELQGPDGAGRDISLVLYNIRAQPISDSGVIHELSLLNKVTDQAPIILISDVDDAEHIVEALEQGIRGYIPTNLALTIAAETLRFVRAGGTFIPASALLALPRHYRSPAKLTDRDPNQVTLDGFTPRQAQVLSCLWQGKQNKTIAYELDMCESTVKVHIRHIMKKLRATNRTEVVFLTRQLLEGNTVTRLNDRIQAG